MIDTYPNKSIGSIIRDMRVPEFLIRQVVHEDIWYISYKMKKKPIFIKEEEELRWKALEQTKASSPTKQALFFLRRETISARIRWWTCTTTVGLPFLHKMCRYWSKLNTQSTSWCLRWSLAMMTSLHSHRTRRPTSSAWREYCSPGSWSWWQETLRLTIGPSHATQTGGHSIDCQDISATTSPRTSGHQTLQIAIPLIIMCGVQLSERSTSKLNSRQG